MDDIAYDIVYNMLMHAGNSVDYYGELIVENPQLLRKRTIERLNSKRSNATNSDEYVISLKKNHAYFENQWTLVIDLFRRWLKSNNLPSPAITSALIDDANSKSREYASKRIYLDPKMQEIVKTKFDTNSLKRQQVQFEFLYEFGSLRSDILMEFASVFCHNEKSVRNLYSYDADTVTNHIANQMMKISEYCINQLEQPQ